MSVRVMQWVWLHGPKDPLERLVLLALADYSDDDGESFPSMIGLGEKASLTDRGARGIVRRLEASGYITVRLGGGRGGKNLYQIDMEKPGTCFRENHAESPVNPEPHSRNDKPGMINPECDDLKPGTRLHKTRNHGSAEPSITINEPSSKNTREEVAKILEAWASPSSVKSFLAYRRASKHKAMTETGARRLAGHLREIFNAGGDTDDALAMAEERGWATVQPDWYLSKKGKSNGNDFDAKLKIAAERLSAGAPIIDHSRRDPFAARPGADPDAPSGTTRALL